MDHATIRRRLVTSMADLLRRSDKIEGSLRRERTPLEGDWASSRVCAVSNGQTVDSEGVPLVLDAGMRCLNDSQLVAGITPTTSPPAASAASATMPIRPTLPPP